MDCTIRILLEGVEAELVSQAPGLKTDQGRAHLAHALETVRAMRALNKGLATHVVGIITTEFQGESE